MNSGITIYSPHDVDNKRLNQIVEVVSDEANKLGLKVSGPHKKDDNRICVFYEDKLSKCFIYVDDINEPLDLEQMSMTIRLMAYMTLSKTSQTEKNKIIKEEKEGRKRLTLKLRK